MFGKKKKQDEEEFVWRSYQEKSYAELEREVDEAYGKYVLKRNIIIGVLAVALLVVFHDIIGFWIRFGIPNFSGQKTDEIVSVLDDPIQEEPDEEDDELIEYYTLEDKDKITLRKQAQVSMSGRVVAKNYLFWGNYLPGGKRIFQSAALFDLGLVWGDLSDLKNLEKYTFYSAKDYTDRSLRATLKLGVKYPPVPWPYAKTHMAHLHIIPANSKIMSSLIYLRKNQPVKIDGYLVDIGDNGTWMRTTLNRFSEAQVGNTREIMYVNKVQIGKKVYE